MTSLKLLAAGAALLLAAHAQAAETVRIGYQTAPDPSQVAIVDGEYDKATGAKIEWRKFDSGAGVIAALASGGIDIGYAGSSPLAAGVTRGAPIKAFLIAGLIGEAETRRAQRLGIQEPKDLVGKKVAVPFVSTTRPNLLFALKHWGIDPLRSTSSTCNRRRSPLPSPAATSTPPMSGIRPGQRQEDRQGADHLGRGHQARRPDLRRLDRPRRFRPRPHPDIVTAFTRVTLAALRPTSPAGITAYGPGTALAKRSPTSPAPSRRRSRAGRRQLYPLADEQASDQLLGKGTAEAIAATSAFLKEPEEGRRPAAGLSPHGDGRVRQGRPRADQLEPKAARLVRRAPCRKDLHVDLEVRDVVVRYDAAAGAVTALDRLPVDRARRVRRGARRLRLRQDHAAQPDGRLPRARPAAP